MGCFVFLKRYIHRLDGVYLSVAVILHFPLSSENVALFIIKSSFKRLSEPV